MIITISGKPGSGKSTVANALAKKLGLKRYSVGDFRREMAKKRGLTMEELNKLGEKEQFTDKDADDWQVEIGKKEDNFIIDGRLSYYFIPKSIKILLNVNPEVGAERIRGDNRIEEKSESKEHAVKMWETRINSDIKRYKQYYNINPYEERNYDLVLDTSNITADQAVSKLLEFIKSNI
jgi:CMP/dCMP kinase